MSFKIDNREDVSLFKVSSTHAVTAAHCSVGRQLPLLALLVGEHDVSTGNETASTALLRLAAFTNHPDFDSDTNENDIALLRTEYEMRFTRGVQPACLPFKFRGFNLEGATVHALGW